MVFCTRIWTRTRFRLDLQGCSIRQSHNHILTASPVCLFRKVVVGYSNSLLFLRLNNDKRGGMRVVSFDRSPFKLFSLKFLNKSVQTPSCERPKTTQRTLFLSFEIKNCFQIAAYCSVGLRQTFHIVNLIETTVLHIHPDIWDGGKNRLSIINIFK